tara:strand:+ start:77506 stop:77817 length:312 start_codon:yes stop_codon:yes gene_type:complete
MIKVSKKLIQGILLVLWLFAIAGPSIITLIDDDTAIVVSNLNEEEHEQPKGKKNKEVEKFFSDQLANLLPISNQKQKSIFEFYILGISSHSPKIFLPPPERIV